MDLIEIELLVEKYADSRSELADLVNELQEQMDSLKAEYMDRLRHAAINCLLSRGKIDKAIKENKGLFDKPRTRSIHGIKFGLQKGKGKMIIADEKKTIKLIKKNYNDEIGVLVSTTESPNKKALEKIPGDELKKLGIKIEDAEDQVLIKATDGDIDKTVQTFLDSDVDAA